LASDGHRPHDEPARGLSPRAILLAIAAVLLTNWWMYHSELVTGRYVTQGIPPLPALIVLILGVALRPLAVRAAPRLALSRAELLTVFVFLTIAVPITASYGVRAFLPHLTMPRYRQAAENEFERINQMIPAWYGPTDPETVRQVYEGAEAGAGVPWGEWTGPLALWTVFLLACFVGALSLVSLLHREWSEGEKLLYPLTFIPLEMTRSPLPGARSLLADPLTWVGIGVSLMRLQRVEHPWCLQPVRAITRVLQRRLRAPVRAALGLPAPRHPLLPSRHRGRGLPHTGRHPPQ